MAKKIIKIFLFIVGTLLGLGIAELFVNSKVISFENTLWIYILFSLLFGIILFLLTSKIIRLVQRFIRFLERELSEMKLKDIIVSTLGFTLGMFLAMLISNVFKLIPIDIISLVLTIITYIIFGYLGFRLPQTYVEEIDFNFNFKKMTAKDAVEKEETSVVKNANKDQKIVDTSVIIDGRILDIMSTGFIEGQLVIPEFVLEELQHIADSSDDLKRKKGRRGLDILKKLQDDESFDVKVVDEDFELKEVDAKLLKLALKYDAALLTTDYNLNKVAMIQEIKVLNINELANAVKSLVIPGEYLEVEIIKKGKGNDQGVGYLEDGTMIVVEGGEKYIGQTKDTVVTSVLQTDAGRMIFVKP